MLVSLWTLPHSGHVQFACRKLILVAACASAVPVPIVASTNTAATVLIRRTLPDDDIFMCVTPPIELIERGQPSIGRAGIGEV
ncbi:hypothetical protein GCM10009555_080820 [Acrocarpospora macrocephala]|uniref:Uncharacterized protein n=1 Tax=Acrocarpospora macrocephala TaxID=150177 RepID=A0A5M3X4X4_9ACTN|nr:hypothetical protein Amac_092840 [Acrocarpospora macrocephala]